MVLINMSTVLIILGTIVLTWFVANELFHSPKARIKILWREIFKLTREITKYNSEDSVADSLIKKSYEKAISKKKKMINALLDYHFDSEEDE